MAKSERGTWKWSRVLELRAGAAFKCKHWKLGYCQSVIFFFWLAARRIKLLMLQTLAENWLGNSSVYKFNFLYWQVVPVSVFHQYCCPEFLMANRNPLKIACYRLWKWMHLSVNKSWFHCMSENQWEKSSGGVPWKMLCWTGLSRILMLVFKLM